MDASNITTTDPVLLVQQLDADTIRARLDAIDRERDALRLLYRAALAAQRRQQKAGPREVSPQ